jgi:hypothetical protein
MINEEKEIKRKEKERRAGREKVQKHKKAYPSY